jgi:hypothetical protein
MATKKEQKFSHHNKSKQQNKEQKSVCGTNHDKRVNKHLGQGTIHEYMRNTNFICGTIHNYRRRNKKFRLQNNLGLQRRNNNLVRKKNHDYKKVFAEHFANTK